ncbi:MAG: bifunctional DNA primase/polymerase [Micromonosporaceae bacterium]
MRTLERSRLARAAARYVIHGWDVVPGAHFSGTRFRCDDLGCPTVGCHPATEHWQQLATRDPSVVEAWWHRTPYAVLLPTGRAFDVIEVPALLGLWALREAPRSPGPVAVSAAGRWMFLVSPGDGLRPELADQLDVILHRDGSWIAAPPTREAVGRARWQTSPEQVGWRLPASYEVQDLLVRALRSAAWRLARTRGRPVSSTPAPAV